MTQPRTSAAARRWAVIGPAILAVLWRVFVVPRNGLPSLGFRGAHGVGNWSTPPNEALAIDPLIQWITNSVYRFTQPDWFVVILIFASAMSVLAIMLVAAVASRRGGVAAGWLAGGVAAFYGPLAYYETIEFRTSLCVLLTVVAVHFLDVAFARAEDHSAFDDAGVWPLIGAGLSLGLLALAADAGTWILVLICLAVLLLPRSPGSRLGRSRAVMLVLVPALVTILPVTAKNVFASGESLLVSEGASYAFYLGNDPGFNVAAGSFQAPDLRRRLRTVPDAYGKQRPTDLQRFFYRQSAERAIQEPSVLLSKLHEKTLAAFSAQPIIDDIAPKLPNSRTAGPKDPRFLLLPLIPLVALGVVLALARRSLSRPALLIGVAWVIAQIVAYPTERERACAIFAFITVAAVGWARAARVHAVGWAVAASVAFLFGVLAFRDLGDAGPPLTIHLGAINNPQNWHGGDWTHWKAETPWEAFCAARLDGQRNLNELNGLSRSAPNELWRDAVDTLRAQIYATESFETNPPTIEYERAATLMLEVVERGPDRPRIDGVEVYAPIGVDPITACTGRLRAAEWLLEAGAPVAALAEASRVPLDCPSANVLAAEGRNMMREATLAIGAAQEESPE